MGTLPSRPDFRIRFGKFPGRCQRSLCSYSLATRIGPRTFRLHPLRIRNCPLAAPCAATSIQLKRESNRDGAKAPKMGLSKFRSSQRFVSGKAMLQCHMKVRWRSIMLTQRSGRIETEPLSEDLASSTTSVPCNSDTQPFIKSAPRPPRKSFRQRKSGGEPPVSRTDAYRRLRKAIRKRPPRLSRAEEGSGITPGETPLASRLISSPFSA